MDVKSRLQFSIAAILALFGAFFLLDALSVVFKGNLSGHSDLYFRGELNLFLGVTFLVGAAAIYRVARRVRQR